MPDTLTTVNYYSVMIANKTGEGAKLLTALKDAGVNLNGLWGYPIKGKNAIVDAVPEDGKAFLKAVKKLGLKAEKKTAFLVAGEDRPGAVLEYMNKCAAAGLNVHACQAICAGAGRYGALLQFAADDLKKAKKVLSK